MCGESWVARQRRRGRATRSHRWTQPPGSARPWPRARGRERGEGLIISVYGMRSPKAARPFGAPAPQGPGAKRGSIGGTRIPPFPNHPLTQAAVIANRRGRRLGQKNGKELCRDTGNTESRPL